MAAASAAASEGLSCRPMRVTLNLKFCGGRETSRERERESACVYVEARASNARHRKPAVDNQQPSLEGLQRSAIPPPPPAAHLVVHAQCVHRRLVGLHVEVGGDGCGSGAVAVLQLPRVVADKVDLEVHLRTGEGDGGKGVKLFVHAKKGGTKGSSRGTRTG